MKKSAREFWVEHRPVKGQLYASLQRDFKDKLPFTFRFVPTAGEKRGCTGSQNTSHTVACTVQKMLNLCTVFSRILDIFYFLNMTIPLQPESEDLF